MFNARRIAIALAVAAAAPAFVAQSADAGMLLPAVQAAREAARTTTTDVAGNTYYVGTANGGVWKTTDGGQTWMTVTLKDLLVSS